MAELECDGGCSYGDGPQEECSAHGRTPRDLWGIIGQLVVERDAALSTIAKVETLHQKREVEGVDGDCATESCEHEDSCPLKKFEVCGECWDRCDEADIYFSERGIAPVLWPCPTIRALGSVPSTGEGNE